jgi:hypothetical protein
MNPDHIGFLYRQSTGELFFTDPSTPKVSRLVCFCYSGGGRGPTFHAAHKNNPLSQNLRGLGPIPQGLYKILPPADASVGAYSFRLIPHDDNEMFGRSAFLIHADAVNPETRGRISEGCIIPTQSPDGTLTWLALRKHINTLRLKLSAAGVEYALKVVA